MEWRIILPVLCLIGFLPVPGNADNNSTSNSTTFDFNIVFYINDTFINAYSNMSDNATINLKNNIITEVSAVFSQVKNFKQFAILQFRNGSIAVDGKLSFYNNDTKPIVANMTQIFNNGNFTSLKIITNLTSITEATTSTTIAPAITANQTTATATTALVSTKLSQIKVAFRINQDYKPVYANLSSPEAIELTNNITNAFTPIYKRSFANFVRMWIQSYRQGSIVTDSVLEFNITNNSTLNVTEVTRVFIDAITNGNLSFKVDNSSINVTDITDSGTTATSATTQTATTTAGIALFNLTFKMADTFTNDLSNMSSVVAINLSNRIISEIEKVFKNVKGYKQLLIRRYSNGSTIVDGQIQCDKASSPSAAELAKALADGVKNGTVGLAIDTKTIVVTDLQTGATASKSPVLASVLTAFWMTLASLLLSAVMH